MLSWNISLIGVPHSSENLMLKQLFVIIFRNAVHQKNRTLHKRPWPLTSSPHMGIIRNWKKGWKRSVKTFFHDQSLEMTKIASLASLLFLFKVNITPNDNSNANQNGHHVIQLRWSKTVFRDRIKKRKERNKKHSILFWAIPKLNLKLN